MARYTGPKNKLSRRSGLDLGLKTKPAKLSHRLNIPPGQHGRKGTKKLSDFGIQLREKQKVKWMYGILETQFRRYFEKATKNPSATGTELLRLLELRLDNTLYRLGFAPTRAAARQLITHGHVSVNEHKVDRPSYQVNLQDTVKISSKATKIPAVALLLEEKNISLPKWLERQATVGKIKSMPERNDADADINENLIIEYYSR
jgi:small subunit ribosomal protein S4